MYSRQNLDLYNQRKFFLIVLFALIGLVFIAKLFYLQVIDDSYALSAQRDSQRDYVLYPSRGLVFDRSGLLVIDNVTAYDLMVIPSEIKHLDTLAFCKLLSVDIDEFRKNLKKAKKYSSYKASILVKQIGKKDYGFIQENLHKYPGFYFQSRTLRSYPSNAASHIVGFIGEANQKQLDKDEYYKIGDYLGISGIEYSYEHQLRGQKGVRKVWVDKMNTVIGDFMDGEFDQPAIAGSETVLGLDIDLQAYGEQLMQNKIGSIVAIEPASGEILGLISSPNYNPNMLVGRPRAENYKSLLNDSLKPLFNRALKAQYPPGSIFKIVQALIALQKGVISLNTGFPCNKSFVGCHDHPHPSDVTKAIQFSCNPYFYSTFKRIIQQGKESSIYKDSKIGFDEWRQDVLAFGLGQKPGIDLPSANRGNVPSSKYYDNIYGVHRWAFSTIYSLSIGQGEMAVTPLQMANLAAIFANQGYYIEPHIIKHIENDTIPSKYLSKKYVGVDRKYFEAVSIAMYDVVNKDGGTARRARISDIDVCGKTGTAENPHGEDHSVFIAFAPKDNPQIAIAVYVENAGFGGTWAAPIASLMIEKYIHRTVSDTLKEKRILEANFINIK